VNWARFADSPEHGGRNAAGDAGATAAADIVNAAPHFAYLTTLRRGAVAAAVFCGGRFCLSAAGKNCPLRRLGGQEGESGYAWRYDDCQDAGHCNFK
jgi:hypothetical protein